MWSLTQFLTAVSMPSLVTVVGTCLLGYVLLLGLGSRRARALRAFPRPKATLPLLGCTLEILRRHRPRLHDWFLDECLRHPGKPWLLLLLGRPPALVLATEEQFEDVLKEQFETFVKGWMSSLIARDMFGDGIFAVDGAKWLHQRKIASQLFSHQMMREIMEATIQRGTEDLCGLLDAAAADGRPADFKFLFDALTTDVFTEIGFGVRVGCLKGDNGFDPEFLKAFTRCPMTLQARSQQPMWLWRTKRLLGVGMERQFAQDLAKVNQTIFKIIADSMARSKTTDGAHGDKAETSASSKSDRDLISFFLSAKTGPAPTPESIRDVAITFIAAGRATTAQGMEWTLVMLHRYPDAMRKVRLELMRELPGLFDGSLRTPSMDDIQRLHYLEAAIKESLRLNPPAPMNSRVANKDTTLRDGTFIPEGTRVIIPTYATARMKWLWGEDACEFKPERWLDENGRLVQVSPFKYLVFHAGPRLCLGVKLTMLEMKIALATIFSRFNIEFERDPHEITYEISLSLPIRGDLKAGVRPLKVNEKRELHEAVGAAA